MDDIYIARQPIYDKDLQVIGFELLYRNSELNYAIFHDREQASGNTIVNSFIHIGIDNLVGTALAFVNLPAEFILDNDLIPMFHEQTVLEIVEEIEPSEEIINGIERLVSNGFKIALDDYVDSEKMQPLLALADFVKIDVLEYKEDELIKLIAKLKNYKLELIAEKVETQQLFNHCQSLGFDYYQGYFFCHPQLVTQKNIPTSKMVVLDLLAKLQHPEVDINEVESTLSHDVTLSYKLLRYINSAAFSLRREIESIKDAIVLLGLHTVKNWASLILMSKVGEDKPRQLVVTALVRAKMAELIAQQQHQDLEKQAFICGLFSVLDALMDKPMVELLDTVILSTKIKLALLDFEDELGQLLKHIILYDQANFDVLQKDNIDIEIYYKSYINAIQWAEETIEEIQQ